MNIIWHINCRKQFVISVEIGVKANVLGNNLFFFSLSQRNTINGGSKRIPMWTIRFKIIVYIRGESRIFKWGGGGVKTTEKSLPAGVQGPLNGHGSSRVLDALSCYLSLILKHSDTKRDTKKHRSTSGGGGGGGRDCCFPAWILHCKYTMCK